MDHSHNIMMEIDHHQVEDCHHFQEKVVRKCAKPYGIFESTTLVCFNSICGMFLHQMWQLGELPSAETSAPPLEHPLALGLTPTDAQDAEKHRGAHKDELIRCCVCFDVIYTNQ